MAVASKHDTHLEAALKRHIDGLSVDIGPRTTSIRSIAETGGMKLVDVSPKPFGVTLPAVFWRRPSIRTSV